MKYNFLALTLLLLPLVINASENSELFAEYNAEKQTLFVSNVEIIGTGGLYYNSAFLHLATDGTWEVFRLSEPQVNDLPELELINSYNPNDHILSMVLVEVNDTEVYKNVKIQLEAQWQILQIEEDHCDFTEQQANELQLCSTLDEIEQIMGCSGIFTGGYLGENTYQWRDLSVTVKSLDSGSERVMNIQSFKYNLSISANC